jgi:hypothetical protein
VTRWFLTLLALLAGVSAHLAPAQARVRQPEASEINLVEALAAEDGAAAPSLAPMNPEPVELSRKALLELVPAAIGTPTVRLQADRARE